ncbi:MAG: hypothetical protein HC865_04160 [Cyanobacteria bacterium RU_5_0]|nr:hypothetical protein [Cyanobacteria bacterium RU_5_0]
MMSPKFFATLAIGTLVSTLLALGNFKVARADTVRLSPATQGRSMLVSGTLGARDEQRNGRYFDLYRFEGTAGQRVIISMNSPYYNFDPIVTLLDSEGNVIAENNDCCETPSARIYMKLPADGTYTIRASSTATRSSGPYILGFLIPRSTTLTLGGQPNPQVWLRNARFAKNEYDDDDDGVLYSAFYEFEGRASQQVIVMMSSSELDAYLTLFDPDDTIVAEDDSSAGSRNARIVYTLPSDGTYSIATTTRSRDPGKFNLWVTVDESGTAPELPRFFCDESGRTPATMVRRRDGTTANVIRWTPEWEELTDLDGVAACHTVSERFEILDFNLDNFFITSGFTRDRRDFAVCAAMQPGSCLDDPRLSDGLIIEAPSAEAAEQAAERLNSAFQLIASSTASPESTRLFGFNRLGDLRSAD